MEFGILIKKIMMGIAGLVGALTIFVLWRPKKFVEMKNFHAGLVVGGMGVSVAIFLSGAVGRYLGVTVNDMESLSAISWFLGVISVGVINLIANFFRKADEAGKDIKQVYDEWKG